MDQPLVSVVIPTLDRPRELEVAVRSALEQSLRSIEVLVVDDGSAVPAVLPQLSGDARLRILRHPARRGAPAARNTGVAAARGRFIAFLDSDDWWMRGKLERQVRLAEKENAWTAVAAGWRYGQPDGTFSPGMVPQGAEGLEAFSAGCWFCPGSTLMIRRDTHHRVGPQDEALARLEDYDWFLRFARLGGRLAVVPEALATIAWRPHGGRAQITQATARVRRRYLSAGADALTGRARGNVAAYLDLVTASAAWYDRQRLATFGLLLRSQLRRPRLGVQLRRWWSATPEPRA